jgi:hypothetical protein
MSNNNEVDGVSVFDDHNVCIHTTFRPYTLQVEFIKKGESLAQTHTRWDWIKRTLNQINEMPIIVELSENNARISMDF